MIKLTNTFKKKYIYKHWGNKYASTCNISKMPSQNAICISKAEDKIYKKTYKKQREETDIKCVIKLKRNITIIYKHKLSNTRVFQFSDMCWYI